jgi:hypothetical protein
MRRFPILAAMEVKGIIARRLANQGLVGGSFATPVEVLGQFAAMQAQDYYGAQWALGVRCGATADGLERLFNDGSILRTHLCRPTWHFVLPADIRWMLLLTGQRVHQANGSMYRKLGLEPRLRNRATDIMAKALAGGKHLDRDALMALLHQARISTDGFRSAYFMMHAELEGVVCSGPRTGKRFTYALLDERAPKAKTLDRGKALAELTRRYFTSRGPASLNDFCLWSGLSMSDAKAGIAMAGKAFTRAEVNGRDNWYTADLEPVKVKANTVHLLPNYDEYGIGYKDRSAFYDAELAKRADERAHPVFRNLILVNGHVAGTWDRNITSGRVGIKTAFFKPAGNALRRSLAVAGRAYARHLGLSMA